MPMARRLKLAATFSGIVFTFVWSVLVQNFAVLMIFGIACGLAWMLDYLGISGFKVAVVGVTVFFVLSLGVPNRTVAYGSGFFFAVVITYYGVKWYSLKPVRELARKERMEREGALNSVWAATKSILQKKSDGAEGEDILSEVMKATGLGAQKIHDLLGVLEADSKILEKNSRYYLVPVYVRILKALEAYVGMGVDWLVLFYLFAGMCAYLFGLGFLVYIVVFEWVFHLPFIPWWSMVLQIFSGGPATIGLGVFLGIGLLTYLVQYGRDHGWDAVGKSAWDFAKRAALIVPQLVVAVYVLLVWFGTIAPVEPFVHAFFVFIQGLGIFSGIFTLPIFVYFVFVIIFSVFGLALPSDDDITLKAPLVFLPLMFGLFIVEGQNEASSHYDYIRISGANPVYQMDYIQQRIREKAFFDNEERMRRMRSKF